MKVRRGRRASFSKGGCSACRCRRPACKEHGVRPLRTTHAPPRQRRFSSNCRGTAAEGQPGRRRRSDGILENSCHRGGTGRKQLRLLQRRQAKARYTAKITMAGGQRGVPCARACIANRTRTGDGRRHAAKAAEFAGTHLLREHGHRRQQCRKNGQKAQPRGKADPQRAYEREGRGDWHGSIIRSGAGRAARAGWTASVHPAYTATN